MKQDEAVELFAKTKIELDRVFKDLAAAMNLHAAKKSLGARVYEEFMRQHFVISGSSIYNTFHGIQSRMPDADYDFFLVNPTVSNGKKVVQEFETMMEGSGLKLQEHRYGLPSVIGKGVLYKTQRSFRFNYAPLFPNLNFVFYQATEPYRKNIGQMDIANIEYPFIGGFDYFHAQAVYNGSNDTLFMYEETMECIINKALKMNPRIKDFILKGQQHLLSAAKTGTISAKDFYASHMFDYLLDFLKRFDKFAQRGMIVDYEVVLVHQAVQNFMSEYKQYIRS